MRLALQSFTDLFSPQTNTKGYNLLRSAQSAAPHEASTQ